ncbi:kinetochore Sim4 complex subunit FTA2-domain-containing protein [Fusarium flagelliforme]|uniref:kinetochore Sim4 complex subunit FTA2-domain-containing protein n=1 Tax=Fusarium flagelliforme TaxID=2675880 RepID=UPI001E8DC0FF|nr:kinetochore Sim4 complex subunit FTA2-domain-containing protein [Fusarium flagelliforme]KAH7192754.1 kinetochore Sim4 complex subunit FTA2-domain-containing protein [Fusarium flagelliforme]
MAAAVPQLRPLPNIEGPKLAPFVQDINNHNFEIRKFLGTGCHSAVLLVAIDGIEYAVKFFKPEWTHDPHFNMGPLKEEYTIDGSIEEDADPPQPPAVMDNLRGQATSFNAECRVYGRLKELGKEKLAVKAHGYIKVFITPEFQEQWESAVAEKYRDNAFWANEYRTAAKVLDIEDNPNQPVYAIVKDYIEDHRNTRDEPTEQREMKQRQIKHIPQMLRNLHQLHKCDIVVRDLKEQQYFEGQITDFSHAWTVPHITAPGHGLRPVWAWKSMAAWDLRCFQVFIINHWNWRASMHRPVLRPTRSVAWRNGENQYNLRSRREEHFGPHLPLCKYDNVAHYDMKCDPPFDSSEFNWRGLEQTKPDGDQAGGGQVDAGQADAEEADPGDVLM